MAENEIQSEKKGYFIKRGKRKVIQIAPIHGMSTHGLAVLCDDNTMWTVKEGMDGSQTWELIPNVPQPNEE